MKKLLVCSIAIVMMLGIGVSTSQAFPPGTYIDDGGIGDLLFFSLYDLRDNVEDTTMRSADWSNYLAIENTSGAWTAFHLRFRAWKKSIEVWDHVILLSPYDVFWMTLSRHADGVELYSADTETLLNSGLIYGTATEWYDYFSPALLVANGFCGDLDQDCLNDEMQAGYIEAIGMWSLQIPDAQCGVPPCTEDTHEITELVSDVNKFAEFGAVGQINVYDILDALFFRFLPASVPLPAYIYPVAPGVDSAWPYYSPIAITGAEQAFKGIEIIGGDEVKTFYPQRYGFDCGNVLAGVLFMTDSVNGRFQMENMIALKNFRTDLHEFGNLEYPPWYTGADNWNMYYIYQDNQGTEKQPGSPWATGDPNQGPQLRDSIQQRYPTTGPTRWLHRDGYAGGIFYPATTQKYFYGYQATDEPVFSGGSPDTYLWYYVQPTWATVVGPTAVDGDDLYGENWNDIWADDGTGGGSNDQGPWPIPKTNVPVDYYGFQQPLGDVGPLNWLALVLQQRGWPTVGYFVHYFNDIFSLDDLENALGKAEIWNTFWVTRESAGANVNTNTDVVLTFPTKHHHFFYGDWPMMWQWESAMNSQIVRINWLDYLDNVDDYRGYLTTRGQKDVEQLVVWPDHGSQASDFNDLGYSIAEWFEAEYLNGPIRMGSIVWDMNQNPAPGSGPNAPPPSPWIPSTNSPRIPHEVNIIRAGFGVDDHTGIGIGDGNALLQQAVPPYDQGHFVLSTAIMELGQRSTGMVPWAEWSIYDVGSPFGAFQYPIPPIGVVIVQNDYSGALGVARSAMAEWHYYQYYWYDLVRKK